MPLDRKFVVTVFLAIVTLLFINLTSAVNRNINIYKQEDGSGTLTQREPITLVTCYKTIKYTQNFTTYNNATQQGGRVIFLRRIKQ